MRVVDAEDADALADPEREDAFERAPERGPLGALEVERVDVLVLLRRVLGVADRAVGAVAEPLRVLVDPRVVGRGLEGDVERDGEAQALRFGGEALERLHPAEFVGNVGVAALDGAAAGALHEAADGPRAAGFAFAGHERAVLALAVGDADRVDGRQVDDVEAHLADAAEAARGVVEGAVLRLAVGTGVGGGAGEELVPRGEGGERRIDLDALRSALDDARARVVGAHQARERAVEGGLDVAAAQAFRGGDEGFLVGALRPRGALVGEGGGVEEFTRDDVGVFAARDAALELVAPRAEGVGPRPRDERPRAESIGHEGRRVLVVDAERHRGHLAVAVGRGDDELGREPVVPVGDDARDDGDGFAEAAAERPEAAVERRRERGDDDARPRLRRRRGRGPGEGVGADAEGVQGHWRNAGGSRAAAETGAAANLGRPGRLPCVAVCVTVCAARVVLPGSSPPGSPPRPFCVLLPPPARRVGSAPPPLPWRWRACSSPPRPRTPSPPRRRPSAR